MTDRTVHGKLEAIRKVGWLTTQKWSVCFNCAHRTRTRKPGPEQDTWLCVPCEVTWETRAHGITKDEIKAATKAAAKRR